MKIPLTISLLVVMITACQFTPDDINYVELTKPDAPELRVIELDLYQDTIFLTYYQDIKFNFSAGRNDIMQVSVLIDGEEKYIRSNYKDSFTLLASDISEGFHKLSFSVITNSNSGSIADLLGAEGYQFFSNEWTLICVKNDRSANYASHEIENGKLKISWENHDKVDFKSYRISKRYHYGGSFAKEYHTTEPFLIDEAYVGENAYYDVFTEYYSSSGYEHQWAEIIVKNSLPEIKIRSNNEGNYEIYWQNNDYFQAVESYKLIDVTSPYEPINLYQQAPVSENYFTIPDAVFGNEKSYQLLVIPKYPDQPITNDSIYFHTTTFNGFIGDKSFPYNQIYSINKNELLLLIDNYIYRYNTVTKQFTDSLDYNWINCGVGYQNFSVSPGGKYFTTKETCNNKLVLMNTSNLSDYKTYPVNHILVDGMNFNSMSVSDNGIVIAKDYNRINIYNVFQDKLIDFIESSSAIYSDGISSTGKYFYIQTSQLSFFKIIDDVIIPVWESTAYMYDYIYKYIAYDPVDTENIILHDGHTLYHKNASDFTTTKSFPLAEEMILNYDFPTRRLLAYSTGYLSVYNIDDGSIVARIKADTRVSMIQHRCRLSLNTIYLKNGICINIPQ